MKFVNCTPHAIKLNNGDVFQPSGIIPRVSSEMSEFDDNMICRQSFGNVTGLPQPVADTIFIVSAMVLAAVWRNDVVAPATGHPETKRNEKGHIISVPGFVVIGR